MLINKLESGTKVNITSELKGTELHFEGVVASDVSENIKDLINKYAEKSGYISCTILEPLVKNDSLLSFTGDGVKSYLTALVNDKPYCWNDIIILSIKVKNNKRYSIVLSNIDAETFNRRESYRQWLGYDALFRINDSKVMHDIILNDMSEKGVGLLVDSKYDIKENDILEIQFFDKEYNNIKKGYIEKLYKFTVNVVRVEPKNDNNIIVGCLISEERDDLLKFIYKKQREKLKNN